MRATEPGSDQLWNIKQEAKAPAGSIVEAAKRIFKSIV
jgi:hypothetical protein